MPTGYTSAVADGTVTDLRTFALRCARAMGALVTMRDDPANASIPLQLPYETAYYDGKIEEAGAELSQLLAMSLEECEARQLADIADIVQRNTKRSADNEAQRARYSNMLRLVEEWRTDAEGIKDFMLQQLHESVRVDCVEYSSPVPAVLLPAEWREEHIEDLKEDIVRTTFRRAEEIGRTDARNRWLKALFASLPPAPPPQEED